MNKQTQTSLNETQPAQDQQPEEIKGHAPGEWDELTDFYKNKLEHTPWWELRERERLDYEQAKAREDIGDE